MKRQLLAYNGNDNEIVVSRRGWNNMSDTKKKDICKKDLVATNYVSTLKLYLPCLLPVKEISHNNPAIIYNPIFKAIMFKLHPSVTVTVYGSGATVFMGAKDSFCVAESAHKIELIINRNRPIGMPPVKLVESSIHNIVASVLAFPMDIDKLMDKWKHVIYKHPKFTGLTLACSKLNMNPATEIVMEIFIKSGKVNITGAKKEEEVRTVYGYVLENILYPAKIKDNPALNKRRRRKKMYEKDEDDYDEDEDENSDADSDDSDNSDDSEDSDCFDKEEDEDDNENFDPGVDDDQNIRIAKNVPGASKNHYVYSNLMNMHDIDNYDDDEEEFKKLFDAVRKAKKF